jgi:molybdopterin synthase sulfur carrier subunit
MKVEVKFFTSLREITSRKLEEIQFHGNLTVGELLNQLSAKYGNEFVKYIYDENGKVHGYLSILVNGESTNVLQGLDTELKTGDTVAILPPVGGG